MSTSAGPAGDVLLAGRYRLGRLMGGGAQAETRLATDERTGAHVVVKTLKLSEVRDWKQLDLFRREAAVLRTLEHPCVPRLLDEVNDEAGGALHLVMEFIPGQTLKERAEEHGTLGEAELWRILWQVCGVLADLHGRAPPTVHRDIKPANIVERAGGDLVLIDFGAVQQSALGGSGMTFVGTPGFMAPEQAHGEATPASDIYALGVTLAALARGCDPEDLPRQGLRVDTDALPVSDELRAMLRVMTDPDPRLRPRDGRALREVLQDKASASAPVRVGNGPPVGDMVAGLPHQAGTALVVVLGVLGMMGTVMAVLLDRVFIPAVFMILRLVKPDALDRWKRGEDIAHQVAGRMADDLRNLAGTSLGEAQRRNQAQLPEAGRLQKRLQKEARRAEEQRQRQVARAARQAQRGRR